VEVSPKYDRPCAPEKLVYKRESTVRSGEGSRHIIVGKPGQIMPIACGVAVVSLYQQFMVLQIYLTRCHGKLLKHHQVILKQKCASGCINYRAPSAKGFNVDYLISLSGEV